VSLSGNLKTISLPDILQLLATGKKTGTLEVRTKSRQKEIAFQEGNIIFAASLNSDEDLLGSMLLRRGQISKADLERAVTMHQKTGRQLGATLVDMQLFRQSEIDDCLRLQIEEIVFNLFAWNDGEFSFHEDRLPDSPPLLVDLNTMNVVMEGTRRIDEWTEIQKVLPTDNAIVALVESPPAEREEIRLSLDEFRLLVLIDGERTLHDLARLSPMGEFVTYRAIYRLIGQRLVVVCGSSEAEAEAAQDEEEILMTIIFHLFGKAFYKIRQQVDQILGEDNEQFGVFVSQYRKGLMNFFPGVAPGSEAHPTFDKFLFTVRSLPADTRYYQLMRGLESMLSEQLEYVYQLLGEGPYRRTSAQVKMLMTEPLAQHRELLKKYQFDENFFQSLRQAERVVSMVRG